MGRSVLRWNVRVVVFAKPSARAAVTLPAAAYGVGWSERFAACPTHCSLTAFKFLITH